MATKGKSAEVITQTMSKPKSDVKKSAMKSARRRIAGEKLQKRKLAKLQKYIASSPSYRSTLQESKSSQVSPVQSADVH